MLLELFAALVAGVGLAGLVMGLRWLSGKRLPGWLVPAAAGLGMLAYSVWSEYSWFDRASGALPPQVVVASTHAEQAWYRPWTYLVPQISRAIAVDRRLSKRNDALPGQVLTSVLLMARWEPDRRFGVVFDCTGHRRADLMDEVVIADDGSFAGAEWIQLEADDPVMRTACEG